MRTETDSRTTIQLSDAAGQHATIIPAWGATVQEICLCARGRRFDLLAQNIDAADFARWFRGAKLLPFPNRVKDGRYAVNGQVRQLPLNFQAQHHAIHGLLYKEGMEVIHRTRGAVTLACTLKESPGYPFRLHVQVTYRLQKGSFTCTTEVRNLSNAAAPFGDGWHPYFTLGAADHLSLQLPANRRILVDDRQIPTNKSVVDRRFRAFRRIGNTEFDTGFIITSRSKRAMTRIRDPGRKVTLNIWQDAGNGAYGFVQVFIPPGRASIAVEPMTCAADAFNNGQGLILLRPGARWKRSYGVTLRASR